MYDVPGTRGRYKEGTRYKVHRTRYQNNSYGIRKLPCLYAQCRYRCFCWPGPHSALRAQDNTPSYFKQQRSRVQRIPTPDLPLRIRVGVLKILMPSRPPAILEKFFHHLLARPREDSAEHLRCIYCCVLQRTAEGHCTKLGVGRAIHDTIDTGKSGCSIAHEARFYCHVKGHWSCGVESPCPQRGGCHINSYHFGMVSRLLVRFSPIVAFSDYP